MKFQVQMLVTACAIAGLAACANRDETADASGFTYNEPMPEAQSEAQRAITTYADADRDGFVTRDEAAADPNLARNFDRYDVDDDRRLDRGEFARLEAESRGRTAARGGEPERVYPEPTAAPVRPQSGPARGDTLNRTGVDRYEGE